jgi:hypothetical protein
MNTPFFSYRQAARFCVIALATVASLSVSADNKPVLPYQPGQQPRQLPAPQNLQLAKPDLIVVSVTPGAPPSRPVMVRVQNVGNLASAPTNVKISCAARSMPNTSSNCQMGSVQGNVGALAPGAQETVTVPTGPLGKAGNPLVSARVNACLDSANAVKESNEGNNCGSGNW